MKKNVCRIMALIIAFVICCSLCSCSKISDDEALSLISGLLEKSCEVNEIFYGKGILTDSKSYEFAKEQLLQDSDVKIAAYAEAHADYPYQTVEELKNVALEVYSSSYCESMFDIAFLGHKDANTGAIVEYARFIDNEYGILTQRVDIEDEILYNGRTFDIDSIVIVKNRSSYILFTVDSLLDGEKSDTLKIKMIKEEDGSWKFDTPTY